MNKVQSSTFTRTIEVDGEAVHLFKSSLSGNGACVEMGRTSDGVVVSDTKDQAAAPRYLRYTADEWSAFLASAKAGEFDLA